MRSHWCGELRSDHENESVKLAGWVHRRRDHGGVIFIDLRDREGVTQVVFHPGEQPEVHAAAEKVRAEYVVSVEGKVRRRPAGSENTQIPTGEVEVAATSMEILAESETPPFLIEDGVDVAEELRIRYRYLDIRRPEVLKVLRLRQKVLGAIRAHFEEEGFIEIETPIITKPTPEGARDFLVPSRLQPGNFYALPQSPQLFKQLLMVAGVDRYYQIARCFRDEDPRADRHLEFTQLDMEMAFADEDQIFEMTEKMFARIFREVVDVELPRPFPRITYEEALSRYGSDKPDLRFAHELIDVTEVFRSSSAQVLRKAIDDGGAVFALVVPGQAGMSRKDLDGLARVARDLGASGLAWVAFNEDGITSPLSKFLSASEIEALNAASQDLVLLVSAKRSVARASLGAVRLELADRLGLRPEIPTSDPAAWKFLWVVDPPLVEWNEAESRWDATHHPFTAPKTGQEDVLLSDPGAVKARAYDIVLNGWEMATGSIRIHRPELQRRVFDLIGLDEEAVRRRFGWFLKAFDYGAPPHGGIAPGVDRIVARIAGFDNIRETIAFPKTGAYTDPLTGAPDEVGDDQLSDLRLRIVPSE